MESSRSESLPVIVVVLAALLLAPQSKAQQDLAADKLFATQAGERHGLAYDPGTEQLYTLERASTLVAPLLRSYTLDGTLVAGPDTLNETAGALTRLGLHILREGTAIGAQSIASESLVLLRDATLYVLDKTNGRVIISEAINADFDTGGLCVSPLGGGGKGVGYSTRLDHFFSTNSCCNCSGVAEFIDGQVVGYIPISVPGTGGGGDVKEHPLSGHLWVGNAPNMNSISTFSQSRELLQEYTVLDRQTQNPVGVMRLAFDANGDRLWVLGFDGSVYQAQTQDATGVPETLRLSTGPTLGAVKPNPSASRLAVSVSLAAGKPARLEVVSVSGRLVATHEIRPSGTKDHIVDLNTGALAPGVYVIRVVQDGAAVSRKVIVAR